MFNLLLPIGKLLYGIISPFIGPLIAYWKGRRDARRDMELEALKEEDRLIKEANDAGRDVDPGRLRDKYFRD